MTTQECDEDGHYAGDDVVNLQSGSRIAAVVFAIFAELQRQASIDRFLTGAGVLLDGDHRASPDYAHEARAWKQNNGINKTKTHQKIYCCNATELYIQFMKIIFLHTLRRT